MKKLISLLLVLCMVLGMSVSVFADDVTLNVENGTITINDNGTYKLTGATDADLSININQDVTNVTIDGSGAKYGKHVKITVYRIADNASELNSKREGTFVIKGFNSNGSLSVGSCGVESLTVRECDLKALYLNVSNSGVSVVNNQLNNDGEYPRYDGGKNKNGLQIYADNYDLTLSGNTITSANSNPVQIYGNYEQFQSKVSDLSNNITANGNVLAANYMKIYNDATYAPVEWPDDYRSTEELKKLAEQLLTQNDTSNVDCYETLITALQRALSEDKPDRDATEMDILGEDFVKNYITSTNRKHNDDCGHISQDQIIPDTDDDWYEEIEEDNDTESLVVRIKFDGVDEADFEEIKVNLLKNGKKYDSEELSASKVSKKDWRFEWDNLDEDDDWSVALAAELDGFDAEVVNLRGNYWTITLTPAEVEAPVVSVDKANPETGASDFVGVAAALAVVSVLGGAALSLKQ